MRKRNIKTVAHWVIMSILLLFPILMVGVSSFANDEQSVTVTETYEYETNDVNSIDDLVVGNVYRVDNVYGLMEQYFLFATTDGIDLVIVKNETTVLNLSSYFDLDEYGEEYSNNYSLYSFYDGFFGYSYNVNNYYYTYVNNTVDYTEDFFYDYGVIYFEITYLRIGFMTNIYQFFSISDYLGDVITTVDIENSNYKQEINNWCNGFKNLPVNQWYGQLLNVIGVGQTTNSVMNVIYVYPLYVLWVYLIDLIVDCLLVIIHFGHNALSRLGGDND